MPLQAFETTGKWRRCDSRHSGRRFHLPHLPVFLCQDTVTTDRHERHATWDSTQYREVVSNVLEQNIPGSWSNPKMHCHCMISNHSVSRETSRKKVRFFPFFELCCGKCRKCNFEMQQKTLDWIRYFLSCLEKYLPICKSEYTAV